jgi:hypothetical protein
MFFVDWILGIVSWILAAEFLLPNYYLSHPLPPPMNDLNRYMLGLLIFLVTSFVAQRMSANAMKQLDDKKKLQLIDLFGGNRMYHYAFIILTVFGFYIVTTFTEFNSLITLIVYFTLLLGYIAFTNFSAYRKLKNNNYPDEYINAYLTAATVRFAGVFGFFALVLM